MFQFATTTIINNNLDVTSGLKKFFYDATCGAFVVRGVNAFKDDCVTSVYKREGAEGTPGKAQVSVTSGIAAGNTIKVSVYMQLSGSQSSYFANVWVFKGKPLEFEVEVKNAAKWAEEAAKLIKKYQNLYDDKWIDVEGTGQALTISGKNNFQKITEVEISKYVANGATDAAFTPGQGAFDPNGYWQSLKKLTITDDSATTLTSNKIVANVNDFGTYDEIIKDLILPTAENTGWKTAGSVNMPIPGGKYTQYVLTYEKDRGIMGGDAVGEITKSRTEHNFWVLNEFAEEFEAALPSGVTVKNYNADYPSTQADHTNVTAAKGTTEPAPKA